MISVRQALQAATDRLLAAGVPDAARDARLLLDHAAGRSHMMLDDVDGLLGARFDGLIAQRAARQPVSQIIGRRDFWRHSFHVTGDVLDPRPETETLVDLALNAPFTRLLDLGTGSGCILLSLLAERPLAHGVGVDLSAAALRVAQGNAADLGLLDRADFVLSDWFDGLGSLTGGGAADAVGSGADDIAGWPGGVAQPLCAFDVILSNPPYIARAELEDLSPDVRDWEPQMALTDGADGLSVYRLIAAQAGGFLTPGGRVIVEIGHQQGPDVVAIFGARGFSEVTLHQDLGGSDRVVQGVWPGI